MAQVAANNAGGQARGATAPPQELGHSLPEATVVSRSQRPEPSPVGATRGTFVVPAFREADSVAETIGLLSDLAQRLPSTSWDIVVVDDGSDDTTAEVASEAATHVDIPVIVVRHRVNSGLGGALRTGLSHSTGDVVVTVDCDMSYSIDDIERLVLTWLETRPHIVLASPYMDGGATVDVPSALEFRSRAANVFLGHMALGHHKTLTGMVRAYDGPFIRAMALKAVDADIMVEILYKAQLLRARIEEIPAVLSWQGLEHRVRRQTLTSYRSRWITYKQLVNGYLWRPFWFPLVPALLAGLIFVVLVVLGQVSWGALGVICGVLSVQLTVSSLMSLQSKRYFEELFNLGHDLRTASDRERSRVPSEVLYRRRPK